MDCLLDCWRSTCNWLALVARSQKVDEKEYAQEFTESEGNNLEEEIDDSVQDDDSVEKEDDSE